MTKSKGIGRGGPRKGAGRPRFMKTGKAAYFSTRITEETRALLEVEARRSGLSLSTTVEGLLRLGLEEKAKRDQEGPLRAIYHLMGQLAERIPGPGFAADPQYNWRTNPFMFKAFSEAVSYVLGALQPSGEIVPPPHVPLPDPPDDPEVRQRAEFYWETRFPRFDTPKNRGRQIAGGLLYEMQFHGAVAATPDLERVFIQQKRDVDYRFYGQEAADANVRHYYGLVNAGRHLIIKPEEESERNKRALKAFRKSGQTSGKRSKPDTDDGESKK
jgi:hypothetical protein